MFQVKIDRNIKYILIVLLLIVCFLFLIKQTTQSAYESNVGVVAESQMAGWNIKINNQTISSDNEEGINLSYTITENGAGRNNKAAPGSILEYPITIDASSTDVAVKFTLEVTDKTIDDTKILQVKSITAQGVTIIKTSQNEYTGVISKSDLSTPVVVTLTLEWPDDGSLVEYKEEDDDDDYFTINFEAVQYRGETITPYG